jgi:uncharacterized protein DUF1592/uncharacterized protein DUF1588
MKTPWILRFERRWLLVPAVVGAAACTGLIGDGDDGSESEPTSTATSFVCHPDAVPESLPLRRLSRVQFENTVGDLVRFALPGEADAVIGAIDPLFERMPEDLRIGPDKHYAGYTRLDQAVQQDHVDGAYGVAAAVGEALTSNDTRLGEVVGPCAVDADAGNDDACLDDFIQSFGERALRRAVGADDVAFYRQPAGQAPFEPADYADVIALLLNAPHLLYIVEHGAEGSDAIAPLDGYELASRLSFHFWQTMPDETLFAAARSGDLATEAGWQAQVERVLADPRTDAAIASFFGEWLENTTLEELDSRVGTPVFDAFAGDYMPGADLREHMLAEVVDAALYYTRDAKGSYEDFFASQKSFAKTDDLAAIYGLAPWTGGEPPDFGDPTRAGLLTRAAYLATGSANTRPIMKGVFIRKAILCDEIPPPPPNAAANPPMLSDAMSTRQVVEELTKTGVCASCHPSFINPLGFASENFDALGRKRSEQTLYDADTGAVVGTAPIDTTGIPHVDEGDETAIGGAADLVELVLASEKPRACFARQYFRFTFGRIEDLDKDGCALADVKSALDDGLPLAEVLRAVAMSKNFRERSFD